MAIELNMVNLDTDNIASDVPIEIATMYTLHLTHLDLLGSVKSERFHQQNDIQTVSSKECNLETVIEYGI